MPAARSDKATSNNKSSKAKGVYILDEREIGEKLFCCSNTTAYRFVECFHLAISSAHTYAKLKNKNLTRDFIARQNILSVN